MKSAAQTKTVDMSTGAPWETLTLTALSWLAQLSLARFVSALKGALLPTSLDDMTDGF